MTFISEYDVPGLRRLLAVALRNHKSPHTIFERLQECLAGMYSPHGDFNQRDYDIAFIAKALGGPRLLFALQHAFGIPSVTTTTRNHHVPEIHPCVGTPCATEIKQLLDTLMHPDVRSPPSTETIRRIGRVLMMDGVAIEEVCRYERWRDVILGICREHGGRVPLFATDYEAIQAIEKALERGDCHIGKDATVVAIASLTDPDDYLPIPVLVSASCKQETADELAHWISVFLEVWRDHPYGEALHGPIVTIASDGESTFRAARFKLAMSETIDASTPAGRTIHKLQGLSKKTGPRGLLGTCDPKHIFKRTKVSVFASNTLLTILKVMPHFLVVFLAYRLATQPLHRSS